MNSLTIAGRATRDPEIKYLESGTAVAKFAVAVRRFAQKADEQPDFFDVEAWGKAAEFAAQYVKKGQSVAVSGRLESRKHEGKTYWTLKAEQINPFLEKRGEGSGEGSAGEELPF